MKHVCPSVVAEDRIQPIGRGDPSPAHPHSRGSITSKTPIGQIKRPAVLATAVFYGDVRLIDHMTLLP
jgi:hypothetical protein